jgi:hypothetical protein
LNLYLCYVNYDERLKAYSKRASFWLAALFISALSPDMQAQEKFGPAVSNFGGINAVHINPTATNNGKIFFDVNLVTIGISFENNFVFIHKNDFSFPEVLRSNPVFPNTQIRGEGIDYRNDTELINAFIKAEITGPSFSVTLGEHSFGVFSRATSVMSAKKLPVEIGILSFEGIEYEPLQNIPIRHDKFRTANLNFAEIGINYAYRFISNYESYWTLGFNLRRAYGYAGAYIDASNADYTLLGDTAIDIRSMNVETGFSLPLDYNSSDFLDSGLQFRGGGMLADIGITYRKHLVRKVIPSPNRFCEQRYQPYLYKIGLSFLDLGSITFNQNAQEHAFYVDPVYWPNYDTLEFESVNILAGQFSELLLGNTAASLVQTNNMRIGAPAAISVQADYQYYTHWYLAGAMILPLKIHKYQLERPAQLFLSLRYETDIFEINLPLSLYDFYKPRVGLYARYRYLSIGSDKLGGFFGLSDLYGMDFYVSLKFHLTKGFCQRTRPYRDCRNLAF